MSLREEMGFVIHLNEMRSERKVGRVVGPVPMECFSFICGVTDDGVDTAELEVDDAVLVLSRPVSGRTLSKFCTTEFFLGRVETRLTADDMTISDGVRC